MNLKLFAVGCLFATLLSSCADKPRRGGPPPDGGGGGISMGNQPPQDPNEMADELGLAGDQRNKFVKIMQEHGEKVWAIRSNSSMSQKDRRSKMMSAREKLQKQVKGVLTPDQFTQWQEKRQALRNSMQGQQGAGAPPQGTGGAGAPQGYGLPPGPGYGAPQQPRPLGNEPPPPLPGNQ